MIDSLISALNAVGVDFVRDAWKKSPPGDYGVVDVVSASSLWADDSCIAQAPLCNVWLYTHDSTDETAKSVQGVLNAFDGAMGWRLIGNTFVDGALMVCWQWQIKLQSM